MTTLQLSGWSIEFDKAATAAAYRPVPFVNQGCKCLSCENYYRAALHFPQIVLDFLANMGIDVRKPSEIYDCCTITDGKVLYGGFYHIVGNYLSGNDAWQPVKKKRFWHKVTASHPAPFHKIEEGFEVGFTTMVALVPAGFPRPILQMEVSFEVPWVLEEEYPSL